MSETATSIRVVEIKGERYRYRVESMGDYERCHTVDMAQMQGLGSCTCEHYLFTVASNQQWAIKDDCFPHCVSYVPHAKKQPAGVTQCRHIMAAERQLMRKQVRPFLSSFINGDPVNKKAWKKVVRKILNWSKNESGQQANQDQ